MNRTKKFGVSCMIIICLLTLFPQKAHAQYVDVSNAVKEYVADTLAYFAANQIIKKVSASTVNWINSGFKGNPTYVTDPNQFFLEIGDTVASDFLQNTGLDQLCAPFRPQVRLALVKNYLNEGENYSCTLSAIRDNYDAFTSDFTQGGWEGWFEVTQNSNNNPYGAYLNAQSGMGKKVNTQVQKYVSQINNGGGFLSHEKCKEGSVMTQRMIDDLNLAGTKHQYKVGDCWINNKTGRPDVETVTPGSVINSKLNQVLGAGENRLEAADEVDEILGALLNQLINRVVGGMGNTGLKGLSKSKTSERSFIDQLQTDPSEEPSNSDAGSEEGPLVTCVEDPETHITICKASPGNGGLAACTTKGTGHGNDANPQPILPDLSNVVFELTDVSKWEENGNLSSASADDQFIRFTHNVHGSWPSFDVKKEPNDPTFASAWIFIWRKNPAPIPLSTAERDNLSKLLQAVNTYKNFLADPNNVIQASGSSAEFNKRGRWERIVECRFDPTTDSNTANNSTLRNLWENCIKTKIDLVSENSPVKVTNVIGKDMDDLQSINDSFMQFIDNAYMSEIGHLDAADVLEEKRKIGQIQDVVNRLLPKLNDIVNPPAPGGGKWHAVPFAYLTDSHPNEREVDYAFCGGIGGARTLLDFAPTAGDVYHFMLSTPARDSIVVNHASNEHLRTNIIDYQWPAGIVRPRKSGDLPDPNRNDCAAPPTTLESQQTQEAVNFMIPLLEAIPKMNPIVTPPPQSYQDAVENVVRQINSRFPSLGTGALYYPAENVIGMPFNYVVGPATVVVSNQVGIGDTWRNAMRVTCGSGGGGGTGHCIGPDNNNFQSQVDTAVDAVVADTAFSSLLNTPANSEAFVVRVRDQLVSMGLTAFSGVMSGNDVMHYDNKVGVQENSSIVERYEIVNGAGDGNVSLATAADSEYLNDIPIDCVDPDSASGGGGGGGGGGTTGTIRINSDLTTNVSLFRGANSVGSFDVNAGEPLVLEMPLGDYAADATRTCDFSNTRNPSNGRLTGGGSVTITFDYVCAP